MNELYCNKLVSSYEGTHPKSLLISSATVVCYGVI